MRSYRLALVAKALVIVAMCVVVYAGISRIYWTEGERRLNEALPAADRDFLATAEKFSLVTLDPMSQMREDPADTRPRFHTFSITGEAAINAGPRRKKVIEALYSGIRSSAAGSYCFLPRHGIRAVLGNQELDVLVCFECEGVEVWKNDTKRTVTISTSVHGDFDDIYRAAGLTIAP